MNEKELAEWLFENGGPVIRYRTATELFSPSSEIDTSQLLDDLMNS